MAAVAGGSDPLAASLLQLLRTPSGEPPRRAALHPATGAICDKCDAEGCKEIPLLSGLCEVVRRACGLTVYPRNSAELMRLCLDRNIPGAWLAAYNDLKSNDLDGALARTALAAPGAPQAAISALLSPKDAGHMLHLAGVLASLLDGVEPEAKAIMGRTLSNNLQNFVDVVARHGAYMRQEVRDAVLMSFSRLLGKAGLQPQNVAELLARVLDRREHDMAMLFVHTPVAECTTVRPQLLRALLDRARAAPPATRYPLLALLARVVAADPAAVQSSHADVHDLVMSTLGATAQLDARVALLAAMLVQAVPSAAGPLGLALAKALERTAAALVARPKTDGGE